MITKTVFICEHCSTAFDNPCEAHEVECLAEKQRVERKAKAAARYQPLYNVLLGEKPDDVVGAKINGTIFLLPWPFTKKVIKAICGATELISTAEKPSEGDARLIRAANEILSR